MSIIKRKKGFTLLEMLLVILIMTAIAFFAIRMQQQKFKELSVNRTATQINQIFAAATSYYIDNGDWPQSTSGQNPDSAQNISILTKNGYLPAEWLPAGSDVMLSPFGVPYVIGPLQKNSQNQDDDDDSDTKQAMFSVSLEGISQTQANTLKAKLPMSYIIKTNDKDYTLTAFISIPSYDYNHAKTVSDVGVYHPGDCVPKPTYACPRGMKAATFVTVEQAYGFGSGTDSSNNVVYPITGISAYAIPNKDSGGASTVCPDMPVNASYDGGVVNSTSPAQCPVGSDRVCIKIQTTDGTLNFNDLGDNYANTVGKTYLLAMSKCVPTNDSE